MDDFTNLKCNIPKGEKTGQLITRRSVGSFKNEIQ